MNASDLRFAVPTHRPRDVGGIVGPHDEPGAAVTDPDDTDPRDDGNGPDDGSGGAGQQEDLSYPVRAAMVAAAWAVPGVLSGLLAAALLPGFCDPALAATTAGVLFGAVGAWDEPFG